MITTNLKMTSYRNYIHTLTKLVLNCIMNCRYTLVFVKDFLEILICLAMVSCSYVVASKGIYNNPNILISTNNSLCLLPE